MTDTERLLKEIKELIAMQNTILLNMMAMMTQLGDVMSGQKEAHILCKAVAEQVLKYNCEDVKKITV